MAFRNRCIEEADESKEFNLYEQLAFDSIMLIDNKLPVASLILHYMWRTINESICGLGSMRLLDTADYKDEILKTFTHEIGQRIDRILVSFGKRADFSIVSMKDEHLILGFKTRSSTNNTKARTQRCNLDRLYRMMIYKKAYFPRFRCDSDAYTHRYKNKETEFGCSQSQHQEYKKKLF
ncbi:hypothetical protein K501DRAFT_276540 [Backusella circina FSU 941]|nr:hypothetical protein K501DRAFT_276540 [Backusella circina FSU 941]